MTRRVGMWLLRMASVLLVLASELWMAALCLEHPDNTQRLIENNGLKLLGAATLVIVGLTFHCAIAILED